MLLICQLCTTERETVFDILLFPIGFVYFLEMSTALKADYIERKKMAVELFFVNGLFYILVLLLPLPSHLPLQ